MLYDIVPSYLLPSEYDEQLYRSIVPADHFLRKALEVVPWDDFHHLLAPFYSRDEGRPAELPVMMLKLEYLRYHHNLSDREVVNRATTDLAFRHFLRIPVRGKLPDPSSLCVFRGRLGLEGFRKVFQQVVSTAREHGVVKDRLRIKDATHVLANIAVPSALALVAQTRDKLLAAAKPFVPEMVEGERVNLEMLREATKELKPSERLVTRVAQLKGMLAWADDVAAPEKAETNRAWQTFLAQRDLAHKILDDQENPKAGDRTISTTDPDARCGKHGKWFDGYYFDILIDPDSELITQINVLPGNAKEVEEAAELIRQEQAAHGNTVEALSIDGAASNNGPLLRELEDDLKVDTYVPIPKDSESEMFTPRDFQEDKERGVVTCPAGQTSRSHFHDDQRGTTKYRFDAATCLTCAMLALCMKNAPKRYGRTVCKSDYQVEHERARQKATTPQYAEVRREHPKVERKLGEVMNRHGGRRARYRGTWKVLIQELMASTATNVKRLVRLGCAREAEVSCEA